MAKAKSAQGEMVVVTTDRRLVVGGRIVRREGTTIVLADARCCLYWPRSVRGFLGLAAVGPVQGARVSPPVPEMELLGVTSISRCTPDAAQQWEQSPWSE